MHVTDIRGGKNKYRLATFCHLSRGLVYFLWMDLLLYLRCDVIGSLLLQQQQQQQQPDAVFPSAKYPFWICAYVGTLASWFYFRALLEFYVCVFAVLTLPTHLCLPSDYPPVSEAWTRAYTVRGLWGRSWHQLCRSFNAVHGRALCDGLGIPRGTLRSGYVQLGVAFAMTTVSHWAGALMMSGRLHGEFRFFMAQPVAIAVEDGVLAVGKTLGVKGSWQWRLVGYFWVSSWLVWSGWRWFDAMNLADTWMWDVLRPHVAKRVVQRFAT